MEFSNNGHIWDSCYHSLWDTSSLLLSDVFQIRTGNYMMSLPPITASHLYIPGTIPDMVCICLNRTDGHFSQDPGSAPLDISVPMELMWFQNHKNHRTSRWVRYSKYMGGMICFHSFIPSLSSILPKSHLCEPKIPLFGLGWGPPRGYPTRR